MAFHNDVKKNSQNRIMNGDLPFKMENELFANFETPHNIEKFHAELEDINQCQYELAILSDINNDLRNQYLKLEGHLDSVSKSLDQNSDWMKEFTSSLESKNAELEMQIRKQNDLMDEIASTYFDLSQLGVNVQNFKDVDFPLIVSIAGEEFPISKDALYYQIESIMKKSPYYAICKNSSDFTRICSELMEKMNSLNENQDNVKDFEHNCDYEKKIKALLKYNQIEHAKIAEEMKSLNREKEDLLRKFRKRNANSVSEMSCDDFDLF